MGVPDESRTVPFTPPVPIAPSCASALAVKHVNSAATATDDRRETVWIGRWYLTRTSPAVAGAQHPGGDGWQAAVIVPLWTKKCTTGKFGCQFRISR
ncbi:MAG: hypothetical protein AMXMBFR55_10610 [Gemmatimonadota bacterium]|jgi:hypothetical protein